MCNVCGISVRDGSARCCRCPTAARTIRRLPVAPRVPPVAMAQRACRSGGPAFAAGVPVVRAGVTGAGAGWDGSGAAGWFSCACVSAAVLACMLMATRFDDSLRARSCRLRESSFVSRLFRSRSAAPKRSSMATRCWRLRVRACQASIPPPCHSHATIRSCGRAAVCALWRRWRGRCRSSRNRPSWAHQSVDQRSPWCSPWRIQSAFIPHRSETRYPSILPDVE